MFTDQAFIVNAFTSVLHCKGSSHGKVYHTLRIKVHFQTYGKIYFTIFSAEFVPADER